MRTKAMHHPDLHRRWPMRFTLAKFMGANYLPGPNAPVAQLDRASDYESEGRTFESFRAHQILLQ
ncbi:hypothetical protein NOVOSPHI9U_20077 [Novosphingobium sp. 9U]|nr:hypothetical protein NOVOSPHI9U_20077 [Novosphingobium sp. 9U]